VITETTTTTIPGEMLEAARLDREMRRVRPGRPLLVGQAPGPRTEGWPALLGDSGDRIARLAGVGSPDGVRPAAPLISLCERVNILDRWPGASAAGGDLFPVAEARAAAERILAEVRRGGHQDRFVVLVGSGVCAAFGFRGDPYDWVPATYCMGAPEWVTTTVATLPHPSGKNRHWNRNRRRADPCAGQMALFDPSFTLAGDR
jgi:hypothetical protein